MVIWGHTGPRDTFRISEKLPMCDANSDLSMMISFTDTNINKTNVFSLFLICRSQTIPRCWRFLFSPQTVAVLFLISFVELWEIVHSSCLCPRITSTAWGPLFCACHTKQVTLSPTQPMQRRHRSSSQCCSHHWDTVSTAMFILLWHKQVWWLWIYHKRCLPAG